MKTKLLLLLLLFCTGSLQAQNQADIEYTIKGVLLDSLSMDGEPYATIRITNQANPSKPVKMAVTDMKGQFKEKFKAPAGNYIINITSIGKQPINKEFKLQPSTSIVDLGTLYSIDATKELGVVEVVAQKPLVKAEIDRITYNIEDDPDSQTNSILEMLRKVPLVTVDGEENIKVNGSSSFKVHVNGRPNQMMSNNPTEVLRSMPANSIKNIEVITNPGAKYDAEGIGGILNIVTTGGGFEGYTATLSAGVSNRGANGSLYTTVKKNKFTLTLNYSYNHNKQPKSYSDNTRENLDENDNVTARVTEQSASINKSNFQYGNMEASYEIDTLRLLSMSAGLFGGNNRSTSDGSYYMDDIEGDLSTPAYRYQSDNHGKGSWYSLRGNVDYQRVSASNKDRYFTLSYRVSMRPSSNDSYSNYLTNPDEISDEWINRLMLQNFKIDGSQQSMEQTFQVDYTTPFAKINTLEVGAKYIMRNNTSKTWRYESEGVSDDYAYDESRSSHYKHLNDIIAAYLGYNVKYKNWSGKAGVRYEHTTQNVKFLVGPGENFKARFNDFVPSALLGYKLTDFSNVKLGYDMRIRRPGIWYLNPYVNDQNASYITKGNPDLHDEKSHSFNLTYSNFTQKFNFNFTTRYSFNNDGIESYTRLIKEGELVPELDNMIADRDFLFQTYENMGKSKNLAFGGIC